MKSNELDLAPLKERLASATPGPWRWDDCDNQDEACLRSIDKVMQVLSPMASVGRGGYGGYLYGDALEEDKRLIEKCPEDISALIEEVEQLREQIARMRSEHAKEVREMERDFQDEARGIAAEARHNATYDDPHGTW